MIHEVLVPVLDQTGDEVLLVGWLKHVGDEVVPGDVLCEVETAKATVELQAEASGILRKQLIEPGQSIPSRTVVALIGSTDEPLPDVDPFYHARPAPAPSAPEPAPSAPEPEAAAPEPARRSTRLMASPRAKKLAADHGIDLAQVQGTGPQGSIIEEDVRAAIAQAASRDAPSPVQDSRVSMARAERVARSWQTIPHFYMRVTADLTAVIAHKDRGDGGITFTDYLAFAIARALEAAPAINGHWGDEGAVLSTPVHLGLVVEAERGLVVPVLRDLGGRSLLDIAAERSRLVEAAHAGKLSAQAMSGATFTLSNIGPGAIEDFTAIISPPQLAILAAGSLVRRPVVVDDQVLIRPAMTFTLGADHRAVDGRQSAAFLNRLKETLETADFD